ncbi:hypothetical protein D5086_031612 [Populus alba]|uniref:Uncharacterized protein n=1 Tax=Populus alba TaxID=43335 RepID=A0ACC4AJZ9_POPAL
MRSNIFNSNKFPYHGAVHEFGIASLKPWPQGRHRIPGEAEERNLAPFSPPSIRTPQPCDWGPSFIKAAVERWVIKSLHDLPRFRRLPIWMLGRGSSSEPSTFNWVSCSSLLAAAAGCEEEMKDYSLPSKKFRSGANDLQIRGEGQIT